jgi:MFS family permease
MRRALELITACILVDSMLYILLPVIYRDLGIAELWQVGLLLAANRLFRIPASPVIRWIVERWGVYRSLQFAAALAVLTSIGYAFAYGFWAWLILRMIWGLAWGVFRLSGYIGLIQAPITDGNAASAGMMQRSMQIGSLFGMFVGGWLAEHWGIDWTVTLFATLMALAWVRFEWSKDRKVLASLQSDGNDRSIDDRDDSHPINPLKRGGSSQSRTAWGLWIQAGIIYFVSYAIHVLTSVYLEQLFAGPVPDAMLRDAMLVMGGAVAWAGWLHGFRFLVQASCSVQIGHWIDRYGMRRWAWASALIVTLIIMLILPSTFVGPVWLGMVLWTISLWMASILGMWLDAFAMNDARDSGQMERKMSGFSLATDLGAALAPIVSFVLLEQVEWFALFSGFALLYAGCLIIAHHPLFMMSFRKFQLSWSGMDRNR